MKHLKAIRFLSTDVQLFVRSKEGAQALKEVITKELTIDRPSPPGISQQEQHLLPETLFFDLFHNGIHGILIP